MHVEESCVSCEVFTERNATLKMFFDMYVGNNIPAL